MLVGQQWGMQLGLMIQENLEKWNSNHPKT